MLKMDTASQQGTGLLWHSGQILIVISSSYNQFSSGAGGYIHMHFLVKTGNSD